MEEGHFYLQRKGKEKFKAHFKIIENKIYEKYHIDSYADSGYDIALCVVELIEIQNDKPIEL